jgi:hypothetical protein
MITEGPYGYAGMIPCHTCCEFLLKKSNSEPKEPIIFPKPPDFIQKVLKLLKDFNGA